MDYTTLTTADKLALAQERLRNLQTDHFRISLAPAGLSEVDYLKTLEAQITEVEGKIAPLEAAVQSEQPAQPASAASAAKE